MPVLVHKQCPALCAAAMPVRRVLTLTLEDEKEKAMQSFLVLHGRELVHFQRTRRKFPISVCDFPILSLCLLFFYCYYYYLHHCLPVRSGSGSGNRSVTCHYWCNSVIRHREQPVCSTLYGGTAGVAAH